MPGLPRSIIKKYGVSKKAWRVFRSGRKHASKTVRSVKSTPRRRRWFGRSHRRKAAMTIPVAPLVGLGVGLAPAVPYALAGNIPDTINWLKWAYLGLSKENSFSTDGLMQGTVPLIVGLLVHKFVGGKPLNANGMLSRAGVPFLRI